MARPPTRPTLHPHGTPAPPPGSPRPWKDTPTTRFSTTVEGQRQHPVLHDRGRRHRAGGRAPAPVSPRLRDDGAATGDAATAHVRTNLAARNELADNGNARIL